MQQALLDELAASRASVSALTASVVRMEEQLASRIERVETSQSATEVLVTYFGRRAIEQEGELATALTYLGTMCEALTIGIANDREDRHALLGVIASMHAISPRQEPSLEAVDDEVTPKVVGGSMFAGVPPSPGNGNVEFPRGWRKWAKH